MLQVVTEIVQQGATGTTEKALPAPEGAVALIAINLSPEGGLTARHMLLRARHEPSLERITTFLSNGIPKSSRGTFPVNPGDPINIAVNVATADATVAYSVSVNWLIWTGPHDKKPSLPKIPFQSTGQEGTIIVSSNTSGANAAQTVDIAPLSAWERIRLLSAWFYTSGGTATGEVDYFDGTTAVTIDSTAAVAEYTFALGTKGVEGSVGRLATIVFRAVIGAAGAGFTSTLILVYEVVPVG